MFKVLICDDEKKDANILKLYMQRYADKNEIQCNITMAEDPAEVMKSDRWFDIALLDVMTGDISGIKLAEELQKRNENTALFFITNYSGYQDEVMNLRVFRFLIKPVEEERLYSGLDKAFEYIRNRHTDTFIQTDSGAYKRIDVNDIIYAAIEERRTIIVTAEGRGLARDRFEELCSILPERFFFRIHKSFIINMHYIEEYAYKTVTMKNGECLAVAPRRQAAFHKCWFDYMERR